MLSAAGQPCRAPRAADRPSLRWPASLAWRRLASGSDCLTPGSLAVPTCGFTLGPHHHPGGIATNHAAAVASGSLFLVHHHVTGRHLHTSDPPSVAGQPRTYAQPCADFGDHSSHGSTAVICALAELPDCCENPCAAMRRHRATNPRSGSSSSRPRLHGHAVGGQVGMADIGDVWALLHLMCTNTPTAIEVTGRS